MSRARGQGTETQSKVRVVVAGSNQGRLLREAGTQGGEELKKDITGRGDGRWGVMETEQRGQESEGLTF